LDLIHWCSPILDNGIVEFGFADECSICGENHESLTDFDKNLSILQKCGQSDLIKIIIDHGLGR